MANILMEALRELRQGKQLEESLESDAQRAHDIVVREIFEPRGLHEKRWAITTCTHPDGYDYKIIAHVFETEDEITELKEEFYAHAPANLSDVGEWKVSNGISDYAEFDYDGCDLDIFNDEDAISFYFTNVSESTSDNENELIQSDSKEAFNHNLKVLLNSGKPRNQALAIAYSIQRKNKTTASNIAYTFGDEGSGEDGFAYFDPRVNRWIVYSYFGGITGMFKTKEELEKFFKDWEDEIRNREGEDWDEDDPSFHWGDYDATEQDIKEYSEHITDKDLEEHDFLLN